MTSPSATPASALLELRRRREMLALAAISLALSIATPLIALGPAGLASLGAYFDGHYYIEIARSFPLPFSPEGRDYVGHAPGFSALLYLARLLTPASIHWGWLALAATWLSALTSVLAFYLLCAELDLPALPASLTFALLNPSWLLVSSAAHSEPLAMTFALLCFVAHLRGSLPWSVVWLSLALLTRFPAVLLGGALAFDLLVVRRQLAFRTFAWLALPLAVFGLYNLYLLWRVPGFAGVFAAQQVFWLTNWTYPFAEMIRQWKPLAEASLFQRELVYGSAALYLVTTLVGLRPSERRHWWLALWAGSILLLHVSLTGLQGVDSFTRLALLAWPASILIVWRCLPRAIPTAAVAIACLAFCSFGVWNAQHKIRAAVFVQNNTLWMNAKVEQLGSDEPHFINFKEMEDIVRAHSWRMDHILEKRRRAKQMREAQAPGKAR